MSRKKDPKKKRGQNFKRSGDYITNQHGVKVSQDEYNELRILVKRVNRKRENLQTMFKNEPVYYGTKRLQENRVQLDAMGEEFDIMIRKRSASLNRFTTRGEFTKYLKGLRRAQNTDYVEYRAKLYKRNYMTTLKQQYKEYPELVKGALMKVRMMPLKDFERFMGTNQLGLIKEHYALNRQLARLIALRESLGIRNHKGFEDTVDGLDIDDYY